jgi:hypothetical protein
MAIRHKASVSLACYNDVAARSFGALPVPGSVLALAAAVIALSSRFFYVFIGFKQRY